MRSGYVGENRSRGFSYLVRRNFVWTPVGALDFDLMKVYKIRDALNRVSLSWTWD
jgi:hypothetical protein